MDWMDEQQTPTQAQIPPLNDVEENKDIAALSYAWVLSVFIFFLKKNSPFVRFHAKQALILFLLSIVVWIIPVVGHFLELLVLALCVFGFLAAAQGQWKELPIVGDAASGRWSHVRQSWKDVVDSVARLWQRVRRSGPKPSDASPSATSAATPSPTSPVDSAPTPPSAL